MAPSTGSDGVRDADDERPGYLDSELIGHAFRPLHLHWQLLADAGESDATVSDEDRRVHGQLLIAASVLWDSLLANAGIDLLRVAAINSNDVPEHFQFNGYADGMLTYALCDLIWTWNQLERFRATDDLDREAGRALVRLLDVMSTFETGADIHKRCDEALGNLLFARPATWDAIVDEATHRHLSATIMDQVKDAQYAADRARVNRREQDQR